jgi:hypothetical protein
MILTLTRQFQKSRLQRLTRQILHQRHNVADPRMLPLTGPI